MKHPIFFSFIAICIAAVSCSPLHIIYNSTSADGERIVCTSNQGLFGYGKGHMEVALGARMAGKDTVLAILITSDQDSDHGIFDKDDRLLVRLADRRTVTLTNIYDKEFDSETSTNYTEQRVTEYGYGYTYSPWTDNIYLTPFEVSAMVPKVYTTKTTNSYALYLISRQDLLDIIDKGVIKLRVEIEDDEFDMPNPGYASTVIGKCYQCLLEGIANNKVRSEF